MHKFNYLCSIILVITLPLMIVILSSNLILRVSETYNFHFNDSQVVSEIPYNVTGGELSSEISSYWSSFDDEDFQVYEKNGNYKDPIFETDEQQAMKKAKNILNIELAAGFLCLVIAAAIYIYLWKNQFLEALRKRYTAGAVITIVLLVLQAVFWMIRPFRLWAYTTFIGVELTKDSTLAIILGDPFFKTYLLFATILGGAILALLTYINYNLTKPTRIFY